MKQKVPLLITTAIEVTAPLTKMADPERRLASTLHAFEQWLGVDAVDAIVVADGSDFEYGDQLRARGASSGKRIEFLRFRADEARTRKQGKGYAEGEIVLHALTRSQILQESQYFAKCTGKLWVTNYARCLAAFDGEFQCAVNGKREIESLDTRVYFASREFWLKHLADAHLRVDDPRGYFLEHSYLDRLREIGQRGLTLTVPPIVLGRSGSEDFDYPRMSLYRYLSRRVRYSIFRRIY
jgi:hypothetical protein